MKDLLIIFGTRPEAIKLCPLIHELEKREDLRARILVTGQHKELLDNALDAFGIVPDCRLDIPMGQSLPSLTAHILLGLEAALPRPPHAIIVHGDTSSAFAAALFGFYLKIPVFHIEAGLRTYDMSHPFPEEFNRRAIALTAELHFAPTKRAMDNLLAEGVPKDKIFVTGNTAIDALSYTVKSDFSHPALLWAGKNKIIFLTAHRRESWGMPTENIFRAVAALLDSKEGLRVIYPVHPNPLVRDTATKHFARRSDVLLTEPLDAIECHNIMARSHIILTDSGGIQEEAPSLGVPVLVTRNTTERPEGVETGALCLVGTDEKNIYSELCRLLDNKADYRSMSNAPNPYGDGRASKRIADIISKYFKE